MNIGVLTSPQLINYAIQRVLELRVNRVIGKSRIRIRSKAKRKTCEVCGYEYVKSCGACANRAIAENRSKKYLRVA